MGGEGRMGGEEGEGGVEGEGKGGRRGEERSGRRGEEREEWDETAINDTCQDACATMSSVHSEHQL